MKIKDFICDPIKYCYFLSARFIGDNEQREINYLKRMFKHRVKEELDFDNPVSFNQKIQWLKLYNRNPEYTKLVDKYDFKLYVEDTLGSGLTFPTLGVWNDFDNIDFEQLPNQFVLKCTHDSGGLVICNNKEQFDFNAARKKIQHCLKRNYFINSREWLYKDVKPRIIAEPLMIDSSGEELRDYKFMCFGGVVRCIFTCTDRYSNDGLKVTFFDTNWQRMPFERHYPADPKVVQKPDSFDEMLRISEKLSADIPFVRVDFYEINSRPYLGEMTFFPGGGMEEFTPREWDDTLGEWIKLPPKRR